MNEEKIREIIRNEYKKLEKEKYEQKQMTSYNLKTWKQITIQAGLELYHKKSKKFDNTKSVFDILFYNPNTGFNILPNVKSNVKSNTSDIPSFLSLGKTLLFFDDVMNGKYMYLIHMKSSIPVLLKIDVLKIMVIDVRNVRPNGIQEFIRTNAINDKYLSRKTDKKRQFSILTINDVRNLEKHQSITRFKPIADILESTTEFFKNFHHDGLTGFNLLAKYKLDDSALKYLNLKNLILTNMRKNGYVSIIYIEYSDNNSNSDIYYILTYNQQTFKIITIEKKHDLSILSALLLSSNSKSSYR